MGEYIRRSIFGVFYGPNMGITNRKCVLLQEKVERFLSSKDVECLLSQLCLACYVSPCLCPLSHPDSLPSVLWSSSPPARVSQTVVTSSPPASHQQHRSGRPHVTICQTVWHGEWWRCCGPWQCWPLSAVPCHREEARRGQYCQTTGPSSLTLVCVSNFVQQYNF